MPAHASTAPSVTPGYSDPFADLLGDIASGGQFPGGDALPLPSSRTLQLHVRARTHPDALARRLCVVERPGRGSRRRVFELVTSGRCAGDVPTVGLGGLSIQSNQPQQSTAAAPRLLQPSAPSGQKPNPPPLPSGWDAAWSDQDKKYYFYHADGRVTWDVPTR
eukprot:1063927-Rhodomonas_salina.1